MYSYWIKAAKSFAIQADEVMPCEQLVQHKSKSRCFIDQLVKKVTIYSFWDKYNPSPLRPQWSQSYV